VKWPLFYIIEIISLLFKLHIQGRRNRGGTGETIAPQFRPKNEKSYFFSDGILSFDLAPPPAPQFGSLIICSKGPLHSDTNLQHFFQTVVLQIRIHSSARLEYPLQIVFKMHPLGKRSYSSEELSRE
jgi:hypothetical protein